MLLLTLTTSRLRLAPVRGEDLDLLHTLNSDEAVMLNLTGRASTRDESDAEWAQRLGERSDAARGLGYWTGWYAGAFAGWWGLGACSWDLTTANLGYRLLPGCWGRGLATEGSAALLRHAFGAAQMDSVWASTAQQNLASQRVLAKLSMQYLGIQHGQCQYKITSGEWAAARQRLKTLACHMRAVNAAARGGQRRPLTISRPPAVTSGLVSQRPFTQTSGLGVDTSPGHRR